MPGNGVGLESVHLLLTYKCDGECDHCFVWSGPQAPGTMSTHHVAEVIEQASEIDSVSSIYFEGGEPFLFYPVLLKGVELARQRGFEVGIVSNAYWAETSDDAELWLRPLAELGVSDLSLSSDDYHGEEESSRRVAAATTAAKRLGIDVGVLSVKRVEGCDGDEGGNDNAGDVFFRGRAAAKLADKMPPREGSSLTSCPEEPPNITRVHVDAYGNVLFCQGISIGSLRETPLKTIISSLSPDGHPLIGPLIRGGPAALSEELSVRPESGYADACHMCYDIRNKLRAKGRLRDILLPDQAYGD